MKTKSILFIIALFVGMQSFDLMSAEKGAGMFEPTITQYGDQLNVQFTHSQNNLMRVIDINGEGPDRRYIIRYAPSIQNSPNAVEQLTGNPGENGAHFSDDLELSTFTESNTVTVEVYDHDLDYSDPMSLSDPKGKGSVVVNDNTTED